MSLNISTTTDAMFAEVGPLTEEPPLGLEKGAHTPPPPLGVQFSPSLVAYDAHHP